MVVASTRSMAPKRLSRSELTDVRRGSESNDVLMIRLWEGEGGREGKRRGREQDNKQWHALAV